MKKILMKKLIGNFFFTPKQFNYTVLNCSQILLRLQPVIDYLSFLCFVFLKLSALSYEIYMMSFYTFLFF